MPLINCPNCQEIISNSRRACPECGCSFGKKKYKPPVEAEEVLNLKSGKVEKEIEFVKGIEDFVDKKAEEIVKEIRKFDSFVGKKIRNISDNENTGYKLDILDELLQPKDLCQKIVPVPQKEWKHCGCKIDRYLVHRIDRESEHQGFLKKVGAGEFIWYCSKECAVKDNQ